MSVASGSQQGRSVL